MAISLKLVQRTQKQNKLGEAPIYLRITQERKSTFLSTGISVFPKQWNAEKEQVRTSHPISDVLNQRLSRVKLEAQENALSGKSASQTKAVMQGSGGDFVAFTEQYIASLTAKDQVWEAKKFKTTLAKCTSVWGKQVGWKQVTPEALQQLSVYMAKKLGNSVNTRRKEISRVRRLVRLAIRSGDLSANDDPFLVYQLEKAKRVERRKLTLEEIGLIEKVNLNGFAALARDTFLLSFYGGGVRFGDLCVLREGNYKSGRLVYKAAKTGKPLSVPLAPNGQVILGRYRSNTSDDNSLLLPLLREEDFASEVRLKGRISSRNAQVNTYLKRILKKAGVDPDGVSMHVARHSFADLARRTSGDIHAIMQMLGHSDVRVTQVYLSSLDLDAVDQLADQMWKH